MPVCCVCGKYIPEKDPKPLPKTKEEFIEAWNSLGCRSFGVCSKCIIKLHIKESEE